jgi:hypothetical protein
VGSLISSLKHVRKWEEGEGGAHPLGGLSSSPREKRAVSTPEPSFPSREFSRAASEERAWNSPMASSGSAAERRLKLDESILTQQHDVASHARLSSLLQEVTQSALFSRSGHTWCTHCSLLCHRLITSPRR